MKKILSVFAIIIFFVAGCSKTTDKEYFDKAAESVKNGNISDAISSYEKLVDEYPESKLAPDALLKEAALYHDNKVKNVSKEESLTKSAEIFKLVAEKYPKNKQAPQSLFMAGFIYANELKNYDEATKIYKLFLEKYPDNELASSAKDELDNMGLTPEEILKKKIETSQK
jgi:TolA-binding protein